MKGRVEFQPPRYISIAIDWSKLVDKPAQEGYFVEALSSADAIIDGFLDGLVRFIYKTQEAQDLLNEIAYLKGSVKFDGMAMAEVLQSKGAIEPLLRDRIREFKKGRNLTSHNSEGEYALVMGNKRTPYSSQTELDQVTEEEAKRCLREGWDIFNELIEIMKDLNSRKKDFFSTEHYQQHPHVEKIQNKFPRMLKFKKSAKDQPAHK
ncbi:hypothetical protein HYS50_02440 [Candidatus Woesearchaeota archaeon]|nr:hypothetical protein [Candidatus Woesearchaeota archaeon]